MKTDRAIDNTSTPPRSAWSAFLQWIARASRVSLLGDLNEKSDAELEELWLMFLASDPDGVWHTWPDSVRRRRFDDERD